MHLKTTALTEIQETGELQAGLPMRRPFSRLHILLQFRKDLQRTEVLELESRGATIVGSIPDCGVMVAAPPGIRLDDLDLVQAATLRLENKISARLRRGSTTFVVEFHPDVEMADRYELLRENGLEPHYHPDLLPNHLLVYGTLQQAVRLARWDEVAYVYPASRELLDGTRVQACAGPLTNYGPVAQYVASAGDGWDGAGRGAADLGYYLGALTGRVPRVQAQTAVQGALAEWSRYVQVNFVPVASPLTKRTLSIFFARAAHGDGFPFDGAGRVLAHTFYPFPVNSETIAGDMHFDSDESWGIGQNVDIFSVALHEAGHALGLGHSDQPGTVMYPYYQRVTTLTAADVEAIRKLYAARDIAAQPPSGGGTEPGDDPDPGTPQPPTTPPPTPPQPPSGSDRTAPSLRIISPASTSVLTFDATFVIVGTASDNAGVAKVTWTDSTGQTGNAAGTLYWRTPALALRVGSNVFTLRAYDAAGNSSWRAVMVTRRPR